MFKDVSINSSTYIYCSSLIVFQVKQVVETDEEVQRIIAKQVARQDHLISRETLMETEENIPRGGIKSQMQHIKEIRLIKTLKSLSLLPIEL